MAIIEVLQKLRNKQLTEQSDIKPAKFIQSDLYIANNPIMNKIITKHSNKNIN